MHTRLPQSDGSPLRHTLCCRQRKNISVVLRGSPSFDESSKVVMPRAEPQMAAQVVSQVVMKAPTKEAVAAGTAAIGRRSDGVVLERGSRRIPRRRKWSSDRNHRSKLGSGWRGWDCFSCSSRLTCQRNRTQAPLHGVMLWCHDVVRVSRLAACLQATCRAGECGRGATCRSCKPP